MRSTSGTRSITAFSRRSCMCIDCVRLVPGTRNACNAKSPSLRLGTNSLPMRLATRPDSTMAETATEKAAVRWPITQLSTGS
ncbi:hypothetical protein D9M71_220640 [compost metagenome]